MKHFTAFDTLMPAVTSDAKSVNVGRIKSRMRRSSGSSDAECELQQSILQNNAGTALRLVRPTKKS